jgi:hypothetical protein
MAAKFKGETIIRSAIQEGLDPSLLFIINYLGTQNSKKLRELLAGCIYLARV